MNNSSTRRIWVCTGGSRRQDSSFDRGAGVAVAIAAAVAVVETNHLWAHGAGVRQMPHVAAHERGAADDTRCTTEQIDTRRVATAAAVAVVIS